MTIIAYLPRAAKSGKSVIRILSDDTDVFVLLVYWVWKMQLILQHGPDGTLEWGVTRHVCYLVPSYTTCLLLGSKLHDMFVTWFQVTRHVCYLVRSVCS